VTLPGSKLHLRATKHQREHENFIFKVHRNDKTARSWWNWFQSIATRRTNIPKSSAGATAQTKFTLDSAER
jgi:hypothetical protein